MQNFQLRDYQQEAVYKTIAAFEIYDRVLGVAATGAGKSPIFGALAKHWINQNKQVMIIAHREELLTQPMDMLRNFYGIESDLEKADLYSTSNAPCIVASVQSLIGERKTRFNPNLVIVDECQHILSNSYVSILSQFKNAKVFGTSETPFRSDKKELSKYFEFISFDFGLKYFVDRGFVVKPSVIQLPIEIDIREVKQSAGDYQVSDLGEAIEPILRQVIVEIKKHNEQYKTLIFLPLIKTARIFDFIAKSLGIKSEFIHGDDPERKTKLENFRNSKDPIWLCNAMLLTEGVDIPSVQCIVPLRPTKSLSLYQQMIGRGTRTIIEDCDTDEDRLSTIAYSDKPKLLILDFLWQSEKHQLITPANLIATNNEELEVINQLINKSQQFDLFELQKEAEEINEAEVKEIHTRELSLKSTIDKNRCKKRKLVDPIEFALSLHHQALISYEPTMNWESEPVSEKQLKFLESLSFDTSMITTKGHASMILD